MTDTVESLRAELAAVKAERDDLLVKLWGHVTHGKTVSFDSMIIDQKRLDDAVRNVLVDVAMRDIQHSEKQEIPYDLMKHVDGFFRKLQLRSTLTNIMADNKLRVEFVVETERSIVTLDIPRNELMYWEEQRKWRKPQDTEREPNVFRGLT